ncbi:MAG: general secretion pathway protein GspK [Phycisphaerae bacterium]|nr:general secretion pathway protein GspK [Phycisphaerae bacterium]
MKQKGFTLLVSMIVLTLLCTIISRFLYKTSLYLSSSQHRQNKVQCRYAAESGIVLASRLIRNMLQEQQDAFVKNIHDKNKSVAINDIDYDDPNNFSPDAQSAKTYNPFNLDAFVISKKTKTIGKAKVEIEIIDENAKLPLLWIVQSPFEKKNGFDSLKALNSVLDTDYKTREALVELIKQSTKGIKLPQNKFIIAKSSTRRLSGLRNSRSSNTPSPIIWKNIAGKAPRDLNELRRDYIVQVSQGWVDELKNNTKYKSLKEKLAGSDNPMTDYISTWNNTKLNLNTAPAEVIYAAFEPIGMTMEMANEVVKFRNETPLSSPNLLDIIPGLSEISKAVGMCYTNKSDTFTIRVTARLGQAQYKLYSCTIHTSGKIENLAVFTGD